jgi:HemY protein
LRGLYLEAERLGDRNAARHYAGRAAAAAPQLAWAAESTMEELVARGDWDAALKLVDAQKSTRQVDRAAADRRRAVLLTAKAEALFDTELDTARTAAQEANRLQPAFSPAAIVAARALLRQNDVRKASKTLETAWRAEPHPDVADLYVHARPGDAVLDRLNRARKLQEMKKNHPESSLAVARAALEAQDYGLARREADAAIRMDRREGAYLLLADIEEAETGDVGKVRQLLAKAVRAPRDPAWVADGVVSERWIPASPVTGRIDAFEWRAPAERVAQLIESAEHDISAPPVLAVTAQDAHPVPPEDVEDAVIEAPAAGQAHKPTVRKAPKPAYADAAEPEAEQPRLPDDPGVEPQDAETDPPQSRFRLF